MADPTTHSSPSCGFLSPDYESIFNSLKHDFLNSTGNNILSNLTNEFIASYDLPVKCSKLKHKLFCLHLNIQSLNAKLIEFCNFITEINSTCASEIDVIALSEIWSTNVSFFQNILPGYTFIYDLPSNSRTGGVAFFVNNTVTILDTVDKLSTSSDCQVESLFLRLKKKNEIFIAGVIYRHPSDKVNNFINCLEACLDKLSTRNDTFLFGDFNLNLLNYGIDASVTKFADVMLMNNFMPVILLPTRVTNASFSLIDHIYIRESATHRNSISICAGNVIDKLSDHFPNFFILRAPDIESRNNNRPLIRLFNDRNKASFTAKLSIINWLQVTLLGVLTFYQCANLWRVLPLL